MIKPNLLGREVEHFFRAFILFFSPFCGMLSWSPEEMCNKCKSFQTGGEEEPEAAPHHHHHHHPGGPAPSRHVRAWMEFRLFVVYFFVSSDVRPPAVMLASERGGSSFRPPQLRPLASKVKRLSAPAQTSLPDRLSWKETTSFKPFSSCFHFYCMNRAETGTQPQWAGWFWRAWSVRVSSEPCLQVWITESRAPEDKPQIFISYLVGSSSSVG